MDAVHALAFGLISGTEHSVGRGEAPPSNAPAWDFQASPFHAPDDDSRHWWQRLNVTVFTRLIMHMAGGGDDNEADQRRGMRPSGSGKELPERRRPWQGDIR